MSVINKMLRDLDSRQNPPAPTGRAAAANSTDFVRPTVSVNPQASAAPASFTLQRVAMAVAALVLVAGSVAVGWWLLGPTAPMQPRAGAPQSQPVSPAMPVAVAPAAVSASIVVAQVAPEPTPPTPTASAASTSMAMANGTAGPVSAGVAAQTPSIPSIQPVTQPSQPAQLPQPPQASTSTPAVPAAKSIVPALPASAPAIAQVAPPAAASAAPAAALVAPRVSQPSPVQSSMAGPAARSAPAQEVLAQAQTLWNNGARAGAVELLREALAPAERAAAGAGSGTGAGATPASAATVALVRELTRMELAEGRPAQVLTLLTHLEPVIATQADLWAVRGNAAQRLGRHAESVVAYQAALKLRPAEPRWMLGAAVSLAIQGQVTEATDLAEQARSLGPISPDMRGYLRQLGVILREP